MKELKGIDAMEFKVGDHVKVKKGTKNFGGWVCSMDEMVGKIYQVSCVDVDFITLDHGVEHPFTFSPENLTLCLPEKWAIKTDRQEFWDWFNSNVLAYPQTLYTKSVGTDSYSCYCHSPTFNGCHTSLLVQEGYTEITFEYWCRVHRPDLINQQRHFVVTNSEEKELFSISVHPKPEEREIEGYKAPFDMYQGEVKKGDVYQRSISDPNLYFSVNYDEYLPAEWVETWEPVYKEAPKPKFKVGDWVIVHTVPDSQNHWFHQLENKNQAFKITKDLSQYASGMCYTVIYGTNKFGGILPDLIRLATPEEIEKATYKPIWERFPTWESLKEVSGVFIESGSSFEEDEFYVSDEVKNTFATKKHAESALAFAMLSQIEKAWNERMKGFWTVKYDHGVGRLVVIEAEKFKAQITFHSEELAMKSLELHADLWRKFWMV